MLVLTRKPGQSVYIGDDIKVTLHGIRGNQIRIGIEAPSSVKIYREEIYLQILEENKSAAVDLPADLGDVARVWADQKQATLSILSSARKRKPKDEQEEG